MLFNPVVQAIAHPEKQRNNNGVLGEQKGEKKKKEKTYWPIGDPIVRAYLTRSLLRVHQFSE